LSIDKNKRQRKDEPYAPSFRFLLIIFLIFFKGAAFAIFPAVNSFLHFAILINR